MFYEQTIAHEHELCILCISIVNTHILHNASKYIHAKQNILLWVKRIHNTCIQNQCFFFFGIRFRYDHCCCCCFYILFFLLLVLLLLLSTFGITFECVRYTMNKNIKQWQLQRLPLWTCYSCLLCLFFFLYSFDIVSLLSFFFFFSILIVTHAYTRWYL